MKVRTRCQLLAPVALTVAACVAQSPHDVTGSDATVIGFIDNLVNVFPAETGTTVSFTGHFAPIPPELEADLKRYLPQIRFHIAEMLYVHWGPDPVKLLIASDRSSGRVLSYLWSLWFARPTTSLNTIFLTRPWTDQAEFRDACITFARLVAVCMDGHAGQVGLEPAAPGKFLSLSRITVELFNRQGKLWRVMKVHFQDLPGNIAPGFIAFEQTDTSGGATFTSITLAPNNRMQATAGGLGRAGTSRRAFACRA